MESKLFLSACRHMSCDVEPSMSTRDGEKEIYIYIWLNAPITKHESVLVST